MMIPSSTFFFSFCCVELCNYRFGSATSSDTDTVQILVKMGHELTCNIIKKTLKVNCKSKMPGIGGCLMCEIMLQLLYSVLSCVFIFIFLKDSD